MRRRIAHWTATAGLALTVWSPTARADGLTDPIELTNNSGQKVSQVIFEIIPAGAVAPPDPTTSPLTVVPGFADAAGLQVALGEGKISSGAMIEAMRLDFGPGGFLPGDSIEFQLSTASNYAGPLPLPLLPPNSGLQIQYVTPTTSSPPGSGGQSGQGLSINTPEPFSILVWSGLSGLGLALRRRRKEAARA